MKTNAWIGLILFGITCISFIHHFPNPRMITFDVYGYYSYLPAAITYHDLSEFAFVDEHFKNYDLGSGNYQVTPVGDHRIPIYTMGLAMLVSPFYLIADIIASNSGFERDGLSIPYQFFFWLSSIFFMFLGVRYLKKWLEHFIDDPNSIIVICTIALATNYFVYVAFENGLTHGFVFSLYAVLLFYSKKWGDHPTLKSSLQLAVVITLLCLIRPSELISILIPGLYLIYRGRSAFDSKLLLQYLPAMAGMGLLLITPQLLLWKHNTGQLIFNAYVEGGHSFDWTTPHIWEGLFSYRKGWLVYTPVMLLIIPGFVMVYKHAKAWFWPLLIYLVMHIYITMSWDMWWYASSFGSRPMIHAYAALALPIGLLLQHGKKWKPLIVAFILLMGLLNLFQIWQLQQKILPWDGINHTFYWKVFGRTNVDKSTIKYVDLRESLSTRTEPGWNEISSLVLDDSSALAFPDDLKSIEGKWCQEVSPKREFSQPLVYHIGDGMTDGPGKKWLRLEALVFRKGDKFSAYSIAEFGVTFHHDEKIIKNEGIRFPFYVEEGEWTWIDFEVSIPEQMEVGDMIKSFVWNHSPDTIYVSELRLKSLIND